MSYAQCKIVDHAVEFKRLSSGYISVGVDGSLVGNYANDAEAIVAALEHVRIVEHMLERPLLPNSVRKTLREMATVSVG